MLNIFLLKVNFDKFTTELHLLIITFMLKFICIKVNEWFSVRSKREPPNIDKT